MFKIIHTLVDNEEVVKMVHYSTTVSYKYCIMGSYSVVQIFAVFADRSSPSCESKST